MVVLSGFLLSLEFPPIEASGLSGLLVGFSCVAPNRVSPLLLLLLYISGHASTGGYWTPWVPEDFLVERKSQRTRGTPRSTSLAIVCSYPNLCLVGVVVFHQSGLGHGLS